MEGLGKYHGSHVTHSHQQFMDFERFLAPCSAGPMAVKVLHLSGLGDGRGLPIFGRLVGEIQSDTATVYSKLNFKSQARSRQFETKDYRICQYASRARAWRGLTTTLSVLESRPNMLVHRECKLGRSVGAGANLCVARGRLSD